LDAAITDPVADVIEAETAPIPLPPETRVVAFQWEAPASGPAPAACASLPTIVGPP
jgi:hypothetical protein